MLNRKAELEKESPTSLELKHLNEALKELREAGVYTQVELTNVGVYDTPNN